MHSATQALGHTIKIMKDSLWNIPEGARVAVAMSGGVDSSFTAAALRKAGYDVFGVTMSLYQDPHIQKGCCTSRDVSDARRVASIMDFEHYILDYTATFTRDVIDPFVQTYQKGYTPIPCTRCNETVKFRDLVRFAREAGAVCLITGHYVLQKKDKLFRAADHRKDQSYFLFTLTKEQRKYVRFPLGGVCKNVVREASHALGMTHVSSKKDSQDICFIASNYQDFIKKYTKKTYPGPIIHKNGDILGEHQGLVFYTIGQRRGLGLSFAQPLYVVDLDVERNAVIVGGYEDLSCTHVILKDVHWVCEKEGSGALVRVKLRSVSDPVPASIEKMHNKEAVVRLHSPEFGVSPGQACVFYGDNDELLGGGWIEKEHP